MSLTISNQPNCLDRHKEAADALDILKNSEGKRPFEAISTSNSIEEISTSASTEDINTSPSAIADLAKKFFSERLGTPSIQQSAAIKKQALDGNLFMEGIKCSTPSVFGSKKVPGTISYPHGSKDSGQLRRGVLDGKGTHTSSSETVWQGRFSKGNFANGTVKYPNGAVYHGPFLNNNWHGNGELILSDGTSYKGIFYKGEFISGTAEYPNGTKYLGGFTNSQWHGTGILIEADVTYDGVFEHGEFISGTAFYSDNSSYTGKFRNFEFHGMNGKLTLANGRVLKGEFRNNCYVEGE